MIIRVKMLTYFLFSWCAAPMCTFLARNKLSLITKILEQILISKGQRHRNKSMLKVLLNNILNIPHLRISHICFVCHVWQKNFRLLECSLCSLCFNLIRFRNLSVVKDQKLASLLGSKRFKSHAI